MDPFEKAAWHEAGHAVLAWFLISQSGDPPRITTIRIEEEPNSEGVVPGSTEIAPDQIERLSPHRRAVIYLGGWYGQEGRCLDFSALDADSLCARVIDKLNANSECSDDIGRVLDLKDCANEPNQFWAEINREFNSLHPRVIVLTRHLADVLLRERCVQFYDVMSADVLAG